MELEAVELLVGNGQPSTQWKHALQSLEDYAQRILPGMGTDSAAKVGAMEAQATRAIRARAVNLAIVLVLLGANAMYMTI